MSKKANQDAYKKLWKWFILVTILLVICFTGYVLLERYGNSALEQRRAEVAAQNDELIAQHEQAVKELADNQVKPEDPQWPTAAPSGWDVLDVSTFSVNNPRSVAVERNELIRGGMMLLNQYDHSLPADFPEGEIVPVYTLDKTIPVSGSSVRLFPVAIDALSKMLAGAKEAGLEDYLIEEGYRTNDVQTTYFNEEMAKYVDKYTGDALIAYTKKYVNYPGTSEYQSGLSFRISRWRNDTTFHGVKFVESEHSDWLVANSWQYGFVFRFPVEGYPNATVHDKSYKTGETKKLMIYRYVGAPHSTAMHVLDLCMEEYIEYLAAHPHIAIYQDGQLKYEITRVSAPASNGGVTAQINQAAVSYAVSTDNMGGVITSMTY